MPTTIREQVLAAIETRLLTLATATGASFERARVDEVEPAEMPAICMFDGAHEVVDGDTGGITRVAGVSVELYATGASGAAAVAALNALWGQVAAALRPNAVGLTLGGLATDLRELGLSAPELAPGPAAGFYASAAATFEVEFEAAEFDPHAAA